MLSQNTLDKIVYEYQHGGVKQYHPEISMSERKALLKYLFSLPTHKDCDCEVIA
jgi:NADPH-dependent 7-cyano-7-deazaguanine reductase QueF